jgi:hypothetical protein
MVSEMTGTSTISFMALSLGLPGQPPMPASARSSAARLARRHRAMREWRRRDSGDRLFA